MIPGDLIQNLIHAAYVTFDHNQIVVAYLAGFILATILSIWRPNRFSILLLVGFAILGFGFEYDKHLVGPLTRQTLQSIIDNPDAHVRTQKYVNLLLGEVFPVLFYLVGWGFIFAGMIIGVRSFPLVTKRDSEPRLEHMD
jgi:hypothetical protein